MSSKPSMRAYITSPFTVSVIGLSVRNQLVSVVQLVSRSPNGSNVANWGWELMSRIETSMYPLILVVIFGESKVVTPKEVQLGQDGAPSG